MIKKIEWDRVHILPSCGNIDSIHMFEKPSGIPKYPELDRADKAAGQATEKYVEGLNKRLKGLDRESFDLIDLERHKILKLHHAHIAEPDYARLKRTHEVRTIRLEFTKEETYLLNADEEVLDEYFVAYRDVLQRMEEVPSRLIPEDKKLKLLEKLDYERRDIHRKAAQRIQKILRQKPTNPFHLKEFDEIDPEVLIRINETNGRILFEVLHRMWSNLPKSNGLTYSEGALDGVDLEKLRNRIFQETGEIVDLHSFSYGFHENAPRRQYGLDFLRVVPKGTRERIEKIILPLLVGPMADHYRRWAKDAKDEI